ncbi:hypothetical protein EWM64_g9741, partial [Hericium alpestre]
MRFFNSAHNSPPNDTSASSLNPDAARRFTAFPPRRQSRRPSASRIAPNAAPRSILRQSSGDPSPTSPTKSSRSSHPNVLQPAHHAPPSTLSHDPGSPSSYKRPSLPTNLHPGTPLPSSSAHSSKRRPSCAPAAEDGSPRERFRSLPEAEIQHDRLRGHEPPSTAIPSRLRPGGNDPDTYAKSHPQRATHADGPSRKGFRDAHVQELSSRDVVAPPAAHVDVSKMPALAPKVHYRIILLRLKRVLRAQGLNIRDYVDPEDYEALHRQDVADREQRERDRAKAVNVRMGLEKWKDQRGLSAAGEPIHVFSAPMRETVAYASSTAILSGYRHDLPIVLFACVEELYRTGIYQPNLFRDLPNRARHVALLEAFNKPPLFGSHISLRTEATPTICALLGTWLKNLSEPILNSVLFTPFWQWCVKPSVQRDEARVRQEEDEEEENRVTAYLEGRRAPKISRRKIMERQSAYATEDEALEGPQIAVAQLILKLLPTHHFSVFVYLCSFFTQVPLCPENGMTEEDIGKMFGYEVFGGSRVASRLMMMWILKRWAKVSEGLLDAEEVEESRHQRENVEDAEIKKKIEEEDDIDAEAKADGLARRRKSLGAEPKSPAVLFDLAQYEAGSQGLREPDRLSLDHGSAVPIASSSKSRPRSADSDGSYSTVNTRYQSEAGSVETLPSSIGERQEVIDRKGKGRARDDGKEDDRAQLRSAHTSPVEGELASLDTRDSASRDSVHTDKEPSVPSVSMYFTPPTSFTSRPEVTTRKAASGPRDSLAC